MSDKSINGNGQNKHPPPITDSISGFVCPQCMIKFEKSNHLKDHFTTQHGQTEPTGKVSAFQTFISNIRSDGILRRTVDSPAKPPPSNDAAKSAELCSEMSKRLDSMRNENDELLRSLSTEYKKVIELDTVANLILDGTPLPPGFQFGTASLERRVRQYLEISANQATMKSIVESQSKELLEKTVEIQRLKAVTHAPTMEADEPPCLVDNSSGDQNALSSRLTTVNQELEDLDRRRSNEVQALLENLEAIKAELATAVQKAEDSSKQSTDLTRELDRLKDVERQLRGHLVNQQSRCKYLEQTVTGLETVKADLEAKCSAYQDNQTQVSAKLSSLQSQHDQLTAKYDLLTRKCAQLETKSTDLEAKLSETSQENCTTVVELIGRLQTGKRELDSLMLRLITLEDQSKKLEVTIDERDRQIEKLKKVICELGRENQSLQILRERVSSRHWAQDDQCSSCQACCKEFSLSNRRHHCRVCGGIFCQACSSHRAQTPSSKVPVRVCDTCLAETTKPV